MSDKDQKQKLIETLLLICGKRGDARPNSWERVNEIRSELLTDTENYPWKADLEALWEVIDTFQNRHYQISERKDQQVVTPVESLFLWVEMAHYPPPEIMYTITEAFSIYFLAAGKLTLEDVFFGPLKPGVGNFAAQKLNIKPYDRFEWFISKEKSQIDPEGLKKISMEELTERFFEFEENHPVYNKFNDEPRDVDNYLRGYRRWVAGGRAMSIPRTTK